MKFCDVRNEITSPILLWKAQFEYVERGTVGKTGIKVSIFNA